MLSKLGISTPKPWLQQINRNIHFTFAPTQYNNELLKSFISPSAAGEQNNTDLVLENTLYKYYYDKQTTRNELLADMSKGYIHSIGDKEALLVANNTREQNMLMKLDACYKERERYMATMHKQCADLTKELGEKQNEIAELKSFSNITKSDMAKFERLKALLSEYKSAINTANVHEERKKLAKVVLKYNKLIQYFDKLFKTMKQQIATVKQEGVFVCTESGIIARQDADLYKLHDELNLSQYRMEKLRTDHENEIGELRLKHVDEVRDVRREYEDRLRVAERQQNNEMRMMEKRIKELENENGRCKAELTQKDETIVRLNSNVQHLDQTVLDFDGIKQKLDRAISDREAWEQTCRKINKKCQHLMDNVSVGYTDAQMDANDGAQNNRNDIELMKTHLESHFSVQKELREQVEFLQAENGKVCTKLKKCVENEQELIVEVVNLQTELEELKQQRSRDLDLSDEYIALFRNTPGYDLDMQDGRLVYGGGVHNGGCILNTTDSGIFCGSSDEEEEEVEDALMTGQRFASM